MCGYKCIPHSQRKIFEISVSFSTVSFSSNYLQVRFIFLIPQKKKKNPQMNNNKKKQQRNNHGKWYFFFLFEIAGFSATLLHISCLFSSLPAFEQICLDIHIQASPVLVCDVSSVLADAVQLQSFLLLGSGLSGRAKLILRSWGCSPCKKGCWSHISAVTDVLFLRGRV